MTDQPLTTQEGLALVYGWVVCVVAAAGGVLAFVLAAVFQWPGGYAIGVFGVFSFVHARWQINRPIPNPESFLIVDSVTITAAAAIVRLPVFVTASFVYLYAATAIFTTGRRSTLFYVHVTGLLAVAVATVAWAPPPGFSAGQVDSMGLVSAGFFMGAVAVLGRAAVRRFRQVESSRAVLVGKVSHELRNALTGVVGIGDVLAESLREGTCTKEEFDDLVPPMVAAGYDASAIVEDLLTLSRAARGSLVVHGEPTDVGTAVTAVLGTLPDTFVARVEVAVPADLIACADPLRLRQILRNLLTNADRYGGPSVQVSAVASDEVVTITVADDGDGIPRAESEAVFLDYRRAAGAREFSAGVGLGLSVGRQLASAMGGTLTYRREDEWTVFDLTLPGASPAVTTPCRLSDTATPGGAGRSR